MDYYSGGMSYPACSFDAKLEKVVEGFRERVAVEVEAKMSGIREILLRYFGHTEVWYSETEKKSKRDAKGDIVQEYIRNKDWILQQQ